MKRGASLERRTPLRARTGLATKTAPRRGTSLRQVSKKRAAENRVRAALIAELYPERPRCACGCGRLADDIHEILSRARGGSITDGSNFAPLARFCHREATDEAPWAYEKRLVIHSWEASRG